MPKTTQASVNQRECCIRKNTQPSKDSDVSVIITWRNDQSYKLEPKNANATLRITKKPRKEVKNVSGHTPCNADVGGNQPTILRCFVCGKLFKQKIQYKRHVNLHKIWLHKRKKSDEQMVSSYFLASQKYFRSPYLKRLKNIREIKLTRKLYQSKRNNAANFRYQYRMRFFNTMNRVNGTQSIARSIKCTHCVSISYTWLSWKLHKAFHKVTRCPMCNRQFISRNLYRIHRIRHKEDSISTKFASRPVAPIEQNDKRKNICLICNKSFSSKSCLNRHQRVHTGEKPYKCEECGELFRERITLRKHIAKHTGVPLPRNHKCEHCGKTFALSSILHQHVRSHGEKKFECEHCKKLFTHQKILDRHLMTHTTEKQFHCDKCDKKFATKSNMKRHAKTHDTTNAKPFSCEKCDRTFWQAGNLKTHVRVHTKEKPFKCESCTRCFSQRSNLNHHMRVHEGSIARKCQVCRENFMSLDELHNHEIQVHKKPSASDIAELNSSVLSGIDVPDGFHRTNASLRNERKIKCQKCGREFHDASEYIRHLQSNSDRCDLTPAQANSGYMSHTIPVNIQNRFNAPLSLRMCPEPSGSSLLANNTNTVFLPDMFGYGSTGQSFQHLYIAQRGACDQLGTFNKGYLVQQPTPLVPQNDEDAASTEVFASQRTM